MSRDLVVGAALLGGLAYYYRDDLAPYVRELEQKLLPTQAQDAETPTEDPTAASENACPDGWIVSADGLECLPTGNPCSDPCFRYENGECVYIEGCGTVTGSSTGDQLLYLGEYVVAGVVYNWLGNKVATVAERRVAADAAKRAAAEASKKAADATARKVAEASTKAAAEKAAKEAAERAAREAARQAVQTRAQRAAVDQLGKRASSIAVKQTARQTAAIAARQLLSKVAATVARISALQSVPIVGQILGAISTVSLSISVGLLASGTAFEKDAPGDWTWNDLPEGGRVAIEAIPGIGDVFGILGNFLAFRTGCPPGMRNENGLCYEPPHPGFHCEAFLCYAGNDAYAGGFDALSDTPAHMTKRILTDTGTIPDRCRPGQVKSGAFCYDDIPGYHNVAGVAWQQCPAGTTDTGVRCEDVHGGGVGRIPDKKGCGDFPWISNCRDDGTSLWSDIRCNTWWDGCCHRGLFGECYGCVRTNCGGSGKIEVPLWNRQSCRPDEEMRDGLCYERCRDGYRREGLLCTRSFTKDSKVLPPHEAVCPDDMVNIAGLCYRKDLPAGYTRKAVGTLDQSCPADRPEWRGYENFRGTEDVGVSCQRATYTRKPFPAFSIYAMRKIEPPPEQPDPPLPVLCNTLTADDNRPEAERTLCRRTECNYDSILTADGLTCVKKCNDGYDFNFANRQCEKVNADGVVESYDNAAGVVDVQYDFV